MLTWAPNLDNPQNKKFVAVRRPSIGGAPHLRLPGPDAAWKDDSAIWR
jgi:hypothetical protein